MFMIIPIFYYKLFILLVHTKFIKIGYNIYITKEKGGEKMNASILVIEDDSSIQELIVEFLSSQGYNVDFASDGLEGISKFKQGNYDLIILDIMMPNLDGYSVCKMIRKNSTVPIIFLSALNEEENQVKGFELECDDYITKPFLI